MKTMKTAQEKRQTYKLYDDDGNFVCEYKAGSNGITEEMIRFLHKMDDHEVYINGKENRLPEWYQSIFDEWKEKYVSDFQERNGRKPRLDEIPGRFRQYESIDAESDDENDELGDSSKLEMELAVFDEDEESGAVLYMKELVKKMPEQWQKVYQMVFVEGKTKKDAGKALGVSDVMIGKIARKIKTGLGENKELKKYFR